VGTAPRGARFFAAFFPPDAPPLALYLRRILEASDDGDLAPSLHALSVPVGMVLRKHRSGARSTTSLPRRALVSRSFRRSSSRSSSQAVRYFGLLRRRGDSVGLYHRFLGKLLAEDIEDMEPGAGRAVRATAPAGCQWINTASAAVTAAHARLGLYRSTSLPTNRPWFRHRRGGGLGATLNPAFDRY